VLLARRPIGLLTPHPSLVTRSHVSAKVTRYFYYLLHDEQLYNGSTFLLYYLAEPGRFGSGSVQPVCSRSIRRPNCRDDRMLPIGTPSTGTDKTRRLAGKRVPNRLRQSSMSPQARVARGNATGTITAQPLTGWVKSHEKFWGGRGGGAWHLRVTRVLCRMARARGDIRGSECRG